jgi:hypothetical protein
LPYCPSAAVKLSVPSQIILQEADQPDLVVDLAYANGLTGKHGTAVDLAPVEQLSRLWCVRVYSTMGSC